VRTGDRRFLLILVLRVQCRSARPRKLSAISGQQSAKTGWRCSGKL